MSESAMHEHDLHDAAAGSVHDVGSSPDTEASTAHQGTQDGDFYMLSSLISLLLGAALEGTDALGHYLQQWQQEASQADSDDHPDARSDRLRYALMGMLIEGQYRLRRRLAALWRLSEDAASVLSVPWRLATGMLSDPRRPPPAATRRRRWQAEMDRWIALGREAELRGRLLAREAAGGGLDEILDFLAHKPEVRELIEQHGLGLADTAVEEARRRTASADTRVEQLVRAWFRRPSSGRPSGADSSEGR